MVTQRGRRGRVLAGLVLFVGHVVALVIVLPRARIPALVVRVQSPMVSEVRAVHAQVPAALRARVTSRWDGAPTAGLARQQWSITRRGGHRETVGTTQLVGPFLPREIMPCLGYVVVDQAQLQAAGPQSLGHTVAAAVDAELRGSDYLGLGAYQGLSDLHLQWAERAAHPEDHGTVPATATFAGYLRITATVAFARVKLAVMLAVAPRFDPQIEARPGASPPIGLEMRARAHVAVSNRLLQWAVDKLGVDALASKLLSRELQATLAPPFRPPPELPLPNGGALRFTWCERGLRVVEGQYGAFPFSLLRGQAQLRGTAYEVLPPQVGEPAWQGLATVGTGVVLSLDGMNALLFELWRQGELAAAVTQAGLVARFNEDPLVQQYLSLRIGPLAFALPPLLYAKHGQLLAGAEATLSINDRSANTVTAGRAYSEFALQLSAPAAAATPAAAAHNAGPGAAASPLVFAQLRALQLTCESQPGELRACYGLLANAIAQREREISQALSAALSDTLYALLMGARFETPDAAHAAAIRGLRTTAMVGSRNAELRLHLDIAIE